MLFEDCPESSYDLSWDMSSTGTSTFTSIVFSRPASTMATSRPVPPRNFATSSSGRWVAERPIRCGSTLVRADNRSRLRARCEPRLVAATEWISSTISHRTVGRMPLHGAAHLGWRVAGADGGGDIRGDAAAGLDLVANPDQRRAQVAVDVVGESLQRRHIKDATALGLGRRGLGGEAIEAPQEGSQRLAAPGGGGHEDVAAGSHLPPATLLDLGRFGEGGAKPIPGRRRKEIENVPHAIKL